MASVFAHARLSSWSAGFRQIRPTANGSAHARMGHGVGIRACGLYSWSAELDAVWMGHGVGIRACGLYSWSAELDAVWIVCEMYWR
jgi:hypothetical protein